MSDYKIIERKEQFQGKILNLVLDKVAIPQGEEIYREMVLHPGAAAIVPFDDEGNIFLVKQYRHPVGKEIYEIPAGTLEPGEDPKVCAIRELEEEIGYKTDEVTFLMDIYPAVGFSTEIIYIYTARKLVESTQNLDDDEYVDVVKVPFQEAITMITEGKIKDSKTICALLRLATHK